MEMDFIENSQVTKTLERIKLSIDPMPVLQYYFQMMFSKAVLTNTIIVYNVLMTTTNSLIADAELLLTQEGKTLTDGALDAVTVEP